MAALTLEPLAALIADEALRVIDRRNPCRFGGFTQYAEVLATDVSIIGVDPGTKDDCPL
jgi:hypothetical protein